MNLFYYLCGVCLLLCACNDDDKAVIEISLNKNELLLEEGSSERLVASFNPAGTNLEAHSWKSANPQIASVDETGMVTAIKEGNTKITATALNGGNTATCNLTVSKRPVARFSVLEINQVSVNSAIVSGGIAVYDSSAEKGILLSTSSNVTIENGDTIRVEENDFTSKIENLQSGTTYYLKLYAVVDGIAYYGEECSFTTRSGVVVIPTGIQLEAFFVQLEGEEEALNDISGVCYSDSPNPTIKDMKMEKMFSSSEYWTRSSDMSSGTDYYIRAYSTVNGVTRYYEECKIQTIGTTLDKDFGIVHTFHEITSIDGGSYAVYLIEYNIEEKGIYDVKSYVFGGSNNPGDYIMSGDSNQQTISSGKGSFYLYLKRDSDPGTKRSRFIHFINRATGVKYAFNDYEIIEENN